MYQLCGETGLLRREKRTVIISTYMRKLAAALEYLADPD